MRVAPSERRVRLPPCPHCAAGAGELCTSECISFAIEHVLSGGYDGLADTCDYAPSELERLLELVVTDEN